MTTKTKTPTPKPARAATVPEGYMQDARGHLVPLDMIKPVDLTRDELVRELIKKAKDMAALIAQFKAEVFERADTFCALSAAQYGASWGGKKGNVSLTSFDGSLKVLVAVAEDITFDERLQAAKALIDECIAEWSEGSRAELKVLINDAFQTDKEGNLNTGRILGLRRHDIEDPRWKRAMQAIGESTQVTGSKRYVRFYERTGDADGYTAISLDIAGA